MTQPTLYERYCTFDAENPHVYEALKEIARFVQSKGKTKFGMKAIFERLRWMSAFETVGDPYKLNNDYAAFYARRLMREAEFEGLFNTRRSLADEVAA